MNGVLVLDKPTGLSSFAATNRVRHLLGLQKAGHTGTLDPFASGVLVVCLNRATRLVPYLQGGMKVYEATLALGAERDTYDVTGQIMAEFPIPDLSEETIVRALAQFQGEIEQLPPIFSALKVDGRRMYKLARQGKNVERQPRRVIIHHIKLLEHTKTTITLEVACGKGTYIRSLAFDLGRVLGCGAYLKALRRTQNGEFTLDRSHTLDAVEEKGLAYVLSLTEATSHLPTVMVTSEQGYRIQNGNFVSLSTADVPELDSTDVVRVCLPDKSIISLAHLNPDTDAVVSLQPKVVFASPETISTDK